MASPTILIPGIKGTKLVNVNKVHHDTVWSGIQSKYEDIQELILSDDGLLNKHIE